MTMILRNRYASLLALVVAVPFAVVCCGDDSSSEGTSDAGSQEADAGYDAEPSDASDASDSPVDAGRDAALQDAAPPTIQCGSGPCMVDISRGVDNTCVLSKTGDVYCWGDTPCGEVGAPIGDADWSFTPVAAPRKVLSGARAISAGASSTCAILENGDLQCWGSLVSSFSDPTSGGYQHACSSNAAPVKIEGLPPLTAVSSTMSNGCGVTEDKKLWCWGSNGNYLLGREGYPSCSYYNPCSSSSFPPAAADLVEGSVVDVNVTYGGVFAFGEDGRLWSWGGAQAIGRASSLSVDPTPTALAFENVTGLSVSLFGDGMYNSNNACLVSAGRIFCWGGYNVPPRAVAIPQDQYAAQVSAGLHSCARTIDGSVFCWGNNQAGQLGDGTGVDKALVPTKVQDLSGQAAKVVTTKATSCALLVDGEVQCWGANDKGQLGLGTADYLPHLKPGSVVTFQ